MSLLVIQQREGTQGHLWLFGSAVHLQGANWSGVKQRGDTRAVTGSAVASIGVAGPERMPTELAFDWRDSDLRRNPSLWMVGNQETKITRAVRLREVFELIVAEGSLVVVKWQDIDRVGILREYDDTEYDGRRLDATVRIEWRDAEALLTTEPPAPPVNARGRVSQMLGSFRKAVAQAAMPAQAAQAYLNDVQRAANDLGSSMNTVTAAGAAYRDNARSATQIRRGVGGASADVATKTAAAITAVAKPLGDMVATRQDPAPMVAAIAARGRLCAELRGLQTLAQDTAIRLDDERPEAMAKVYTASDGEWLYQVAQRHYGRADLWPSLLQANPHLASPLLSAGDRVRVPPVGSLR